MTLRVGNRQQMVYEATDHGTCLMMDDEELHMSSLSLQFWRVRIAIICYFYHFSYLYLPLDQFYAFSTAFMFEIKLARIILLNVYSSFE